MMKLYTIAFRAICSLQVQVIVVSTKRPCNQSRTPLATQRLVRIHWLVSAVIDVSSIQFINIKSDSFALCFLGCILVGASQSHGDRLAPNAKGMDYLAAFSSRGPTYDGRFLIPLMPCLHFITLNIISYVQTLTLIL